MKIHLHIISVTTGVYMNNETETPTIIFCQWTWDCIHITLFRIVFRILELTMPGSSVFMEIDIYLRSFIIKWLLWIWLRLMYFRNHFYNLLMSSVINYLHISRRWYPEYFCNFHVGSVNRHFDEFTISFQLFSRVIGHNIHTCDV